MTNANERDFGMTIGEFVDLAKDMNAGVAKLVFRDRDGSLTHAVIALTSSNPSDNEEIFSAIEAIEDRWDRDDAKIWTDAQPGSAQSEDQKDDESR